MTVTSWPKLSTTSGDSFLGQIADLLAERSGVDQSDLASASWADWLRQLFPASFAAGFADHHAEFWDHIWSITPDTVPPAFVAVWPRGGAKSTSCEAAAVALGARGARHYCIYVCRTQAQANQHVAAIATMLESPAFRAGYPAMADRLLSQYGQSRGWSATVLRCRSGYTIEAVGLDSAARGLRRDQHRPDAVVIDDIDDQGDTPATIDKNIAKLLLKILPATTANAVVLAVQNLAHPDGIFARLVGRGSVPADFLQLRIVSGPHPALQGAAYEIVDGRMRVVAGTPTWAGQDLAACDAFVNRWGLRSFKTECQHDDTAAEGGLFAEVVYRHCGPAEVPDLVRTVVAVDPAVSATDRSDSNGIQVDGIDAGGTIYRLVSVEQIMTPEAALERAIRLALQYGADEIIVETDNGGDAWRPAYRGVWNALLASGTLGTRRDERGRQVAPICPKFRPEKAGAGHGPKIERAGRMVPDYQQARIVHVLGTHDTLERALARFPGTAPYDLVDACYWSWLRLRHRGKVLA